MRAPVANGEANVRWYKYRKGIQRIHSPIAQEYIKKGKHIKKSTAKRIRER